MRTTYRFGKMFGFEIIVNRVTIPVSGGLWVTFSLIGHFFLRLEWAPAVFWALAAVVLHYLSAIWHQIGHAAAARRTGHPMKAVHVNGLLSFSIYPQNEPELSASIHIRRALGGPAYSFSIAVLLTMLLIIFRPSHRMANVMLWFLALENLLIFCIGALTPLGFTDGSTILRYWRKR